MKIETYEQLKNLHDKYGPQVFGKLCQKFLAITFQMIGYMHIVERGVQGVDIDASGKIGDKYAVEVKTTMTQSVNFEQKDVDGLKMRKEDGYRPVLAVLRLNRFSDWIFAKADKIQAGNIMIDSLRVHRVSELENQIKDTFENVVIEHYDGTLRDAQRYLDNILRQKGVEIKQ